MLYFYSSLQCDTGSPQALLGLIDALDRHRYEPLFWATGEGPLVAALHDRGVQIVRGAVGDVSFRRPLAGIRRVARQAAELRRLRVDLLHVNEFGHNLDLVLGAAIARIPVILHVHNPLHVGARNLHRFIARKVLLVSASHAGAVQHFERIRDRCVVLHNPVDLGKFRRGRSIRAALGFDEADLIVGTVAQLTPNKGIDTLLEAARLLLPRWPRLHVVVVGRAGTGHEEFGRSLVARASEPPFAGRIHFLGSRSDVPDLLASFDVFCLPTLTETFGIVVIEAMAAGVPVVVSHVGGIPEIVASPKLGYTLPPDRPEAFADAIDQLLARPDRARAMGLRGQASLLDRFDHDAYARRLDEVYQAVASRA